MFLAVKLGRFRLSAISVALVVSVVLLMVTTGRSEITESFRLCVVMYHGLTENPAHQNQYMIDPSWLEQDLQYLNDNGYHTIFLSELIAYWQKGTPLPEKPVMLTFDDGYYNNYVYAYPLLQRYGCKAVLSPIGKEAEKAAREEYRSTEYSQCTWQELKEMAESGYVELQNHTYDLHRLHEGRKGADQKPGESDEEYRLLLRNDLQTFQDTVRRQTGKVPQGVIYPFGAYCEHTLSVVKELGFDAAMDCEEKMNDLKSPEDLFHLHRFLRPNHTSSRQFFENCMK